jgi:hypothetical protein
MVKTLHDNPSIIRVMETGKADEAQFKRQMVLKRLKYLKS